MEEGTVKFLISLAKQIFNGITDERQIDCEMKANQHFVQFIQIKYKILDKMIIV